MATADELLKGVDYAAHAKRLGVILAKYYPALMQLGGEDAVGKLPVDVSFTLTNEHITDVKHMIARRVVGISQTTRDDIRGVVERALTSTTDNSIPAIARQLREAGVTSSKARSELISRTETMAAYNSGSLLGYSSAGITKVEALDSDNDPECAARNGRSFTLEEASAIEPHPNCQLAFAPVVE